MSLPPRIALVGFMGSGKSTVGRLLAAQAGYAFVDSDEEIEASQKAKISDIFRTQGEAAFRAMEAETIHRLLDREATVIATGGGAFAQSACADDLLARAVTVYLSCDFAEAFGRVAHCGQGSRPLVERGVVEAEALYMERKSKYAGAHVTIDTTRRSPEQVATDIFDCVRQHRAANHI
ncbi:MAG: shikimate kinase [Vicinamibacteria bacterium]